MPDKPDRHDETPSPKADMAHDDSVQESKEETPADKSEGEGFANPLEFLKAELERVETEKSELHEQLLRMAAEMENLRKRTQKDVADARNYSIAGFAREMLAVADNLNRALSAVSEEARQSSDESLRSLIEGVELTEKSMQQALEKSGVRRISPLNEKFDPHFHQAMFEIPNAEVANNTVLDVVQDGYVIGERVLRPAMVGVSRGGPKTAPRKEEEIDRSDDENGDSARNAEQAAND